jgi:hypothetical protein
MPALPAITAEAVDLYITHLALTGGKRKSARLALIEPHALWAYRRNSEDLREREAEALAFYEESVAEDIEAEMQRRGIKGVKEPVFYEGQKVGHKRVYSDKLLMALAKRHMPQEYGDHITADVNVKGGVLLIIAPLTTTDWEDAYGPQPTRTVESTSLPSDPGVPARPSGQSSDPQPDQTGGRGDDSGAV